MKNEVSETEWARLAVGSAQSGISRPELFRAVIRGDVLGSHIKKPGLAKGVWLVNRKSLDDYIRSFLPGGSRYQKPETAAPAANPKRSRNKTGAAK
jgi:hypothetical protein